MSTDSLLGMLNAVDGVAVGLAAVGGTDGAEVMVGNRRPCIA
jgi:hypothetical protein